LIENIRIIHAVPMMTTAQTYRYSVGQNLNTVTPQHRSTREARW